MKFKRPRVRQISTRASRNCRMCGEDTSMPSARADCTGNWPLNITPAMAAISSRLADEKLVAELTAWPIRLESNSLKLRITISFIQVWRTTLRSLTIRPAFFDRTRTIDS